MRRTVASLAVGLGVCMTLEATPAAADDAGTGVSQAVAALRFTDWTMVHTMGSVKGTDPSAIVRVAGQPDRQMMLMSCVDRPYGAYTHICAMFQSCAEVPKESWPSMIGESPPGTLLVAACAYPLHFYVIRQDAGRLVALRRKMRRANREGVDGSAPDGGAPTFGDPFCKTCASIATEDWQESRALPVAPGITVTTGATERRAAKSDLD